MSIACTCAAPLRASWTVNSPVPQPMSRQRWCAPMPSRYRYFHIRKLPWVGANTPGSTVRSGKSSGNRAARASRPTVSRARACARLARSAARRRRASASGRAWPGLVSASAVRAAAMCSGPTPQQPPMICAPSSRHRSASSAYSSAPTLGLLSPAGGRQVAEVRVHAERQIGEVAQPRHHPGDVVRRHAVDRQRADAHLLEPARRTAERVALGAAPVLAVDAAHAVPAAAEAQPDRQARSRAAPRRSRTSRCGPATASRPGSGRARSCSNARASSRIVSRPSGVSTSPLMLNATATSSPARPSAAASRASRTPRRRDIHPVHRARSTPTGSARPSRSAVGRPQVLVEITSQPTST